MKILKSGQGGNLTQVMMERWGGWDKAWQRAGGVLLSLLSCGWPPGLPVKASSVNLKLWCFLWGWAPGSQLPEQINTEEVLRITTITPSHMDTCKSFKRNTSNYALYELKIPVCWELRSILTFNLQWRIHSNLISNPNIITSIKASTLP